jgi:hypothetical protein
MTPCAFPPCTDPATATNRRGQPTCAGHVAVVVGCDVADGHDASEAGCEQ